MISGLRITAPRGKRAQISRRIDEVLAFCGLNIPENVIRIKNPGSQEKILYYGDSEIGANSICASVIFLKRRIEATSESHLILPENRRYTRGYIFLHDPFNRDYGLAVSGLLSDISTRMDLA